MKVCALGNELGTSWEQKRGVLIPEEELVSLQVKNCDCTHNSRKRWWMRGELLGKYIQNNKLASDRICQKMLWEYDLWIHLQAWNCSTMLVMMEVMIIIMKLFANKKGLSSAGNRFIHRSLMYLHLSATSIPRLGKLL